MKWYLALLCKLGTLINQGYFLEHVTFAQNWKKHIREAIRVISIKLSWFQGKLAGHSGWVTGKANETRFSLRLIGRSLPTNTA